jgi:hypothetical protein
MIETKIKWHKASEELPERSCEVIAVNSTHGSIYNVANVMYSDVHKMFNCLDIMSDKKAAHSRHFSNDVVCWAYFDEFVAMFTHDDPELFEVSK